MLLALSGVGWGAIVAALPTTALGVLVFRQSMKNDSNVTSLGLQTLANGRTGRLLDALQRDNDSLRAENERLRKLTQ